VGGGRGPLPLHLCSSGRSCPPLQLGVQAAPCSRRAWPGLLCVAAPPLALRIACCEPMDGKQAGLKQDRIFFATVGPWA